MTKREALIRAYELCAKAIEEYISSGELEVHGDFARASEQTKVEKQMYGIATDLRVKGEDMEGDDGD